MVPLENRLINAEINMTSTVGVGKNVYISRELCGHGHLICNFIVSYERLQKILRISQFAGIELFYFR